MPRSLVILHDGFTDSEATYAIDRCREEDITVHVATPTGQDPVGEKGWDRIKADLDTRFALSIARNASTWNVGNGPYVHGPWDILILPGGVKSIEKVRLDTRTIEIIKLHHEKGKIIASVCHGAQLLIEADLCIHRCISGYRSIEKDIQNAGAIYSYDVCVDENIVTAPHYNLNGKWMKAVIEKWRATGDSQKVQD